jgi:hypothetical protein
VCKAWHAAAVHTAIAEITIGSEPTSAWPAQRFTNDGRASFTDWLCKYGAETLLLHIIECQSSSSSSSSRPVWQLPLGKLLQLQDLKAVDCSLQPVQANSSSAYQTAAAAGAAARPLMRQTQVMLLPNASSSSSSSSSGLYQNSVAMLASVRSLWLQDVDVQFSGGLNSLSALTGLQHLQLAGVQWPNFPQQQQGDSGQQQQQQTQQQQQQPGVGFLSSLTRLTGLVLDVATVPVCAAEPVRCLQQVSKLTGLHTLSLADFNSQLKGGLGTLGALTQLQSLALKPLRSPPPRSAQQQQQQQLVDDFGFLLSLTQLTELTVHAALLPAHGAPPFECLQQLQVLRVESWGGNADCGVTAAALARLPHTLTHLRVEAWSDSAPFGSSSVPDLASLLSLQQLAIDSARGSGGINLSFCSSMPQLRSVWAQGVFRSDVLHALVDAVPHLTGLERLFVIVTDPRSAAVNVPHVQPLQDMSRYLGLLQFTPQLTQLVFTWHHSSMLPVGCGQYLFAAGVQLPLLKQLVLGAPMVPVKHEALLQATTGRYRFFSENHCGFDAIDACLGPGDVERLVHCCPALELLSIPGLVQPGVDMSPLLQLWQLRELYVGGAAIDDEVAGSVLAHMVGLRRLEVAGAPHLTDAGVLSLAGNKGLRQLLLVRCGLGGSMPITWCGGTGFARCFLVAAAGALLT